MVVRNPNSFGLVSVTSVIFLCDFFFFKKHIASCHWAQVSCPYKQLRLDVSLGSYMLGVGFLRVA